MANIKLVASLRNTATNKLDLMQNEDDGWWHIRLIKIQHEDQVDVKILGVSPEEMQEIVRLVDPQELVPVKQSGTR